MTCDVERCCCCEAGSCTAFLLVGAVLQSQSSARDTCLPSAGMLSPVQGSWQGEAGMDAHLAFPTAFHAIAENLKSLLFPDPSTYPPARCASSCEESPAVWSDWHIQQAMQCKRLRFSAGLMRCPGSPATAAEYSSRLRVATRAARHPCIIFRRAFPFLLRWPQSCTSRSSR
jgi:hypothetical protein